MTVPTTFPAQELAGDGVTTVFPFTFKVLNPGDVEVVTVDSNGNETTVPTNQYTVSMSTTGGSVTFGVAPASGITVFLRTQAALAQTYKISTQQKYDPAENQAAIDQLAIILKQVEVEIERCIKIPQHEVLNGLTVSLSAVAARANMLLGFDPSGNVTVVPTGGPFAGLTPGRVLFAGPAGTIAQSSSLTWDTANLTLTVLNNPTLTYASGEKLAIRGRNDASTTGNSIIAPIYGAQTIAFYDAVQGIGLIPSGSTITQVNGVAGYIKAATASMPNGVCLFGAGMVSVSSATAWGVNTVLMDNSTRTVGALTGISLIGAEYDFNVMCPATSISGITLTGSSLSQPTSANGFRLATLGTGITWSIGFITDNGVCSNFASIGATATAAANIGSQPILFNYFNAASVAKIYQLNVNASGQLIVAGNDTSPVFRLSSAALLVDQTATVTGQFLGKAGTAGSPGWSFSAHTSDGVYWEGNVGAPTFVVGGVVSVGYGGNTMWVPSNTQLNFMTGTISAGGAGFSVLRDANDVLAIKHAANQCTLRVYGNTSGIYATVTSDGTNAFFTQTGGNQIAFATAAKGTTDTVGYMCIPSCAGTPTGVPANIPTGQIPIVYDSTNNFLYVYNGGWKKSTVYA